MSFIKGVTSQRYGRLYPCNKPDRHMTSHHQRSRHHPCLPVSFDVKMGRKYVIYVKKIAVGRYAAIAQPDVYSKKVRRAARKLLCSNCGMFFILYSVSIRIWQVLCT